MRWSRLLWSALVSGSYASVASTAALAAAVRAEGKRGLAADQRDQPLRNGDEAEAHRGINGAHTGIGYLTNHAACIFWDSLFEARSARRGPAGPAPMLRDAAFMAAIAAAVDYGPTPRRFTPSWKLVLSKTGMAVAYAGLALGSAAGVSRTQSRLSR